MSELNLMLGRMLADDGLRSLFNHDPERAGAAIGLTLEQTTIRRLHDLLARMDAMDPTARSEFSSRLNALQRFKQV